MEKNLVEQAERLDDLKDMDEFIYYISINDMMFKNRSMKFMDWSKGMNVVYANVPIPDDHIICDICNWNIALDKPEKIPLLMELDAETESGILKKAICQKCVDKYYPKLICIGKSK